MPSVYNAEEGISMCKILTEQCATVKNMCNMQRLFKLLKKEKKVHKCNALNRMWRLYIHVKQVRFFFLFDESKTLNKQINDDKQCEQNTAAAILDKVTS